MNVTVIFSTYNGGNHLNRTLESFLSLELTEVNFRLIAINNASSDNTQEILERYRNSIPLTILNESQRGKNFALNRALDFGVEDGLVVFTDDDVIVDQYWIKELSDSAKKLSNYQVFGGKILPSWPKIPPDWLYFTSNIQMLYAINSSSVSGEVPLGAILGPNMAIRSSIFKNGLRFNTNIGPNGTQNYIMGSETSFLKDLELLNIKGWFNDAAIVYHQIRGYQLKRKWILKRYFRHGRSGYALDHTRSDSDRFFLGVEFWLYLQLFSQVMKFFSLPLQSPQKRTQFLEKIYFKIGQIYQSRKTYEAIVASKFLSK